MQWRANLYFDMPNFRRRISNCRISLNVNLQATDQCGFSRSLVLTFTSCSPNKPVNTCLPSKFSTHSIGMVISIVPSFQLSIFNFYHSAGCSVPSTWLYTTNASQSACTGSTLQASLLLRLIGFLFSMRVSLSSTQHPKQ